MKNVTLLLLLIFGGSITIAKAKPTDSIIVNGQNIQVVSASPLDSLQKIKALLEYYRDTNCADCLCNFEAQWKIIDGHVILQSIKSCAYAAKPLQADLQKLFPAQFHNGIVKADWLTGELWVTNESPANWILPIFPIWQRETCISITKGIVTSIKTVEYPGNAIGAPNPSVVRDSMRNLIIQNIKRWRLKKLPDHPRLLTIYFKTNTTGRPIEVHILDANTMKAALVDATWQSAITKALNQIKWPVYYEANKQCDINFFVNLSFVKPPVGPVLSR
ncbi:hypothetical protein C8P68_104392 [Mucilaginibacter yixingensis]|uniref:TonB-like protein n=1 Tax=Mucilaginibacter yixingensis TaxID=1295612 RepID=A0A2T5JA15_9SPHI|nr:hypothetical protein [Mucilaginibacter yixingensis]PTQ96898.1 hypothetical protein C8P68_104392 [Mucilaginibacter yixingensis]